MASSRESGMPFSCMRWLLGIQAHAAALRPVPPTCSAASSRMADAPSSAAFTAVLNPATDAPTTTTSASPSHRVSRSTARLISPMAALPSPMTAAEARPTLRDGLDAKRTAIAMLRPVVRLLV